MLGIKRKCKLELVESLNTLAVGNASSSQLTERNLSSIDLPLISSCDHDQSVNNLLSAKADKKCPKKKCSAKVDFFYFQKRKTLSQRDQTRGATIARISFGWKLFTFRYVHSLSKETFSCYTYQPWDGFRLQKPYIHAPKYVIFGMQIWLTGEDHVCLVIWIKSSCLCPGDRRRRLRFMGKRLEPVTKDTRDVLFSNPMNVSVLSDISFFHPISFGAWFYFA